MNQLKQPKAAISILIVEDDQSALAVIGRMVATIFPDTVIYLAENGVMGEELFKKHTPEIVITDINMPLKDGIEMARGIKSINSDTKFIVLTAYNDKINSALFEKIGIHNYLFKPIELDKLIIAIKKCIEEIRVGPKNHPHRKTIKTS
jgi:two-component system response regulator VanR